LNNWELERGLVNASSTGPVIPENEEEILKFLDSAVLED
jgi:hypothetical protein